jgi:hypothetical protein
MISSLYGPPMTLEAAATKFASCFAMEAMRLARAHGTYGKGTPNEVDSVILAGMASALMVFCDTSSLTPDDVRGVIARALLREELVNGG